MNKINSSSINLAEIRKGYIEIPELKNSNIEIESKVHLHRTSKKIIKNINFENNITLNNTKIDFLEIEKNYKSSIIIENCDFKEFLIDSFKGNIKFVNCNINKLILVNKIHANTSFHFSLQGGSINHLSISGDIENKFYINNQVDSNTQSTSIQTLEINNANFKENFKLHNCIVNEVIIKNTDFQKNADFFKSKFTKGLDSYEINFQSINFKGLGLFGDTEFCEKLIFRYVTFEGYNHFKSALLYKGLDLEYTNIQKEINFYGLEILDKTKTSQETYRIIKNQFEKLNNKIEANKYHALELEQRKEALAKNKFNNFSEYIVFMIHNISSKHSTSWIRALLWIMFVGIFTVFCVHFDIFKDIVFNPNSFKIEYINKIFNEFWQYVNITNLDKLKDKPFLLFINKLSLGYLYYQFLTAVRKDTRK